MSSIIKLFQNTIIIFKNNIDNTTNQRYSKENQKLIISIDNDKKYLTLLNVVEMKQFRICRTK